MCVRSCGCDSLPHSSSLNPNTLSQSAVLSHSGRLHLKPPENVFFNQFLSLSSGLLRELINSYITKQRLYVLVFLLRIEVGELKLVIFESQ